MSKNTTPAERDTCHNLDAIQMIEQTIKTNRYFRNMTVLYNTLPHDIQYTAFKKILTYLEDSNKITHFKNGEVFWIFAENKSGLVDLEKNSIPLK